MINLVARGLALKYEDESDEAYGKRLLEFSKDIRGISQGMKQAARKKGNGEFMCLSGLYARCYEEDARRKGKMLYEILVVEDSSEGYESFDCFTQLLKYLERSYNDKARLKEDLKGIKDAAEESGHVKNSEYISMVIEKLIGKELEKIERENVYKVSTALLNNIFIPLTVMF